MATFMCGRFQLALSWAQLVDLYRSANVDLAIQGAASPPDWRPDWSICPTHRVPTLGRDAKGLPRLALARWGFPMPWLARDGKDPWSRPLINARSEQAAFKRTWSGPLRCDRRTVPATAWIEWATVGSRKLPAAIAAEGPVHIAAVAAIFERDGAPVEVVSLLTRSAVGAARAVHDRMPLLVPSTSLDDWIGAGPVPDYTAWVIPTLALRTLPTKSYRRPGHLFEEPGVGDWSLELLAGGP